MIDIESTLKAAEAGIQSAENLSALEQQRVHYLGKKGIVTQALKSVSSLPVEERKQAGQNINKAKQVIIKQLQERESILSEQALQQKLLDEAVDVTLPGCGTECGHLHPVNQIRSRIESIFNSMGFDIAHGPEIEDDYHNFEALNIPKSHPARAMQDTFYLPGQMLLRTHTSPVQIRAMLKQKPPLRLITPGRVYRCDSDVTHTPMFHQVEGLMVAEEVSFADMKGVLTNFYQQLFERDLKLRLRPSYFPFTEPSAEVDIECVCEGKMSSCRLCKGSSWLEVAGCGMVHPNVFQAVGIDNEQYTGFAFGTGIDRLAMLYFEINDLRLMFENDLSFLKQF